MTAIFEKTWTVRASAAKAAQRAGLAKGSYIIAECNGEFAILELEDKAAAAEEQAVLEACGQDDGAAGLPADENIITIDSETGAVHASLTFKPAEVAALDKQIVEAAKKAAADLEALKAPRPQNATNLPTPPDFSKPSHAPYRKRLAAMVAMAEAGDDCGLAALTFKIERSSQKIMARYRDACLAALKA